MASAGLEVLQRCFGEFCVDPAARRLLKSGQPVRIQDQPFEMLLAFLERPGEIVTREDLRRRLWPEGTYVDFDNSLNAAMNKLREALEDSADSPRFIETLPRRGYRFIGAVRASEGADPTPTNGSGSQPRAAELEKALSAAAAPVRLAAHLAIGWQRFWLGAAAGISAVAFLALGYVTWQNMQPPSVAGAPASSIALAVLPFKNLSGDPAQDFFVRGLTEEMITQLGRLQPGRLNVASSSAVAPFQDTTSSLAAIGRQLKVAYVLEGGVRREGNRVRITAQLVHVSDGLQVVSQGYESAVGDVLEVQKDVAARIARALEYELLAGSMNGITSDHPAVHAYLHGRFLWNRRSPEAVHKALEYFQQAAAADPSYAPAYAGIADCYAVWGGRLIGVPPAEAYRQAREAAEKALQFDPNLAEAHATLAGIRFEHEWDFAGADAAFRRAIELKPDYAQVRQWYAEYLAAMGRYPEALAEIRRALELDPFSRSVNLVDGQIYMYMRDYDAAIARFRKLIELHPDFPEPYAYLNRIYLQQGRGREFAESFLEWARRSGLPAAEVEGYRRAFQRGSVNGLLRERKRMLLQQTGSYFRAPYIIARIHAVLGEHDQALQWLEKAMHERDDFITHITVDPEFDGLRADARFQTLLARIQLPAAPAPAPVPAAP